MYRKGTLAPALSMTSSRVPIAATVPSLMKIASATGGSVIVTTRPTMTTLPPSAAAVADGTTVKLDANANGDGVFVELVAQPASTRAVPTTAVTTPSRGRAAALIAVNAVPPSTTKGIAPVRGFKISAAVMRRGRPAGPSAGCRGQSTASSGCNRTVARTSSNHARSY